MGGKSEDEWRARNGRLEENVIRTLLVKTPCNDNPHISLSYSQFSDRVNPLMNLPNVYRTFCHFYWFQWQRTSQASANISTPHFRLQYLFLTTDQIICEPKNLAASSRQNRTEAPPYCTTRNLSFPIKNSWSGSTIFNHEVAGNMTINMTL